MGEKTNSPDPTAGGARVAEHPATTDGSQATGSAQLPPAGQRFVFPPPGPNPISEWRGKPRPPDDQRENFAWWALANLKPGDPLLENMSWGPDGHSISHGPVDPKPESPWWKFW